MLNEISIFDSPWWLIGLGLSLVASLFGTLGKVLMKLSHVKNESKSIFAIATLCVVVLNPVFDAMSYAYAAQSVLAPMAGLSVAWNTILSPYFLQEKLTKTDIKGAYWIVSGCVLVGISGSHQVPTHSRVQLFALFKETGFLMYAALVLASSAILFFMIKTLPKSSKYRKVAYGVLSGLIGGNLFFLKAAVELLHDDNDDIWSYVETYLIVFGALGTAGGGLMVLNQGLRDYEALYLVAMYQSFLIIIGSISGAVFFHEMSGMKAWWQDMLYPLSILMTINGIMILSRETGSETIQLLYKE